MFVEEERIMAIQGIPAMAWYAGFVVVARTPAGWQISSLEDVRPEDIITLPLGKHQPWRDNPEEVALSMSNCFRGQVTCKVIGKEVSAPSAKPAAVIVKTDTAVYRVDLAKLHSGEWVFLDKRLPQ